MRDGRFNYVVDPLHRARQGQSLQLAAPRRLALLPRPGSGAPARPCSRRRQPARRGGAREETGHDLRRGDLPGRRRPGQPGHERAGGARPGRAGPRRPATRSARPRRPAGGLPALRQQRPDGEFMHRYDRLRRRPIDTQGWLYFSSEAPLALARAYAVTGDPADLEAAPPRSLAPRRAGLALLRQPPPLRRGALDLPGAGRASGIRAPDPQALDFCTRWRRVEGRDQARHRGRPLRRRRRAVRGRAPAAGHHPGRQPDRGHAGHARGLGQGPRRPGRGHHTPVTGPPGARVPRAAAACAPVQAGSSAIPTLPTAPSPRSEADLSLRIDHTQHAGSALVRWQ